MSRGVLNRTPPGAILTALALAQGARAHGFDERYDLPVPLAYFATGAALTVALTLLAAILFARGAAQPLSPRDDLDDVGPGPQGWTGWIVRLAALGLFCITVTAALAGTGDPLMNLAPTLIWIAWWVGLSLLVTVIGDIWPWLDPWRTLFDLADHMARRLGRPAGVALGWRWPVWLGAWPAAPLLLSWAWLEVVQPLAAVPFRVGVATLAWTAVNLLGMIAFGRDVWQSRADVFALQFATLGRLAPLARDGRNRVRVCWPGERLIVAPATPRLDAFVLAMLAGVMFDGLHANPVWIGFERWLRGVCTACMDVNGLFAGTLGLALTWLVFYGAFRAACAWPIADDPERRPDLAAALAPTLVPIAAAYNLAHNFSALLIQGQNLLPLLSDPLGRGWNLLGTAGMRANIGIVDARTTWYVAVTAIVAGHMLSIWLAHRVALSRHGTRRRAAIATLPISLLMIGYTAASLLVIAEPMVEFTGAAPGT